MALSTFDQLWKGVKNRAPLASPFLAQDWVRWSFRELIEKRKWSWMIKRAQIIIPQMTNNGTVTVTLGSNVVVGQGTTFTRPLIGQQFRIGNLTPIYDIIDVPDSTHLILNDIWGCTTEITTGYRIYLAYAQMPDDFHSWISIWDANFSWQLWTTITQTALNIYDAQRASQGTPYVVADYDYTTIRYGGATVTPPIPRYEIWPHQQSQYVLPFLYETRPPDLDDSTGFLPRYIPGDVLMEGALAQCARWPGTDKDHVNPYFNLALSKFHEDKFQARVRGLELQDDEVYGRDVTYEDGPVWPMAPLPFPINSSYLQLHAI